MAKSKQDFSKPLLVTSALPYANGDIHLGHLVEVVQTDIYVRYKKLIGRDTIYACADDTHGTPIQLNAQKRGITCEELIQEAWDNHVRDYAGFNIGFDIFYSTNSQENRKWAEYIYDKLQKKDLITQKVIEQYYCEDCGRFLPDRFICGTCPKCDAKDQYGDVCEKCNTTYDPTDLMNPHCITCKSTPVLKKSKHMFVNLAKEESFLRDYLTKGNVLQEDMCNFVMNWVDGGLKEWCISRDEPYFGFKIPGTENKYFYVWLDAPVGYIAATDKWCQDNNKDIDSYWKNKNTSEVVHFIGKDIVYFHTLFWPVMLNAADLTLPSKVFVHGFLTVDGEKMSKTRGTFILAKDFLEKVENPAASEFLRFYYGSKLNNNSSDIDLNIEELCTKVNTTLANNIGNLHHRTFVFLDRFFDSTVPNASWDAKIAEQIEQFGKEIADHFENVELKSIIEKIHAIGNIGNKYYQDTKPWELVKTDKEKAAEVMVTCVNIIKACAVFLKPFVPKLVQNLENQYKTTFAWQDHSFSLKEFSMGKTEKIVKPLEVKDFDKLMGTSTIKQSDKKGKGKKKKTIDPIEFTDFQKTDLRIGIIKEAEKIEDSEKLLKLQIDTGARQKQIIAGIGKHYKPEDLIDQKILFVANLKPAKLMGHLSEGMVLVAQKGKKMVLMTPQEDIAAGAKVS